MAATAPDITPSICISAAGSMLSLHFSHKPRLSSLAFLLQSRQATPSGYNAFRNTFSSFIAAPCPPA